MREEHHQVAAKRHTLLSILKESASNVLSNMQRDQNEVDGTPELEIECRIGRLKQLWRRDGEASAPRIEGFSPSDHTRIETTVERRLGSTVWVLSSDRTKRNRVCFESSVTPAEFRHLRDALAAEGDVVRTGSVTTDYKYPNNRRIIHDHETNIMDQQTKAKKKNHVLDLYCPECKIDLRFAFALEKTESLKIDQVRSGFDYVRHKFRESFIRPSQSKFIRIDLTHVRSFRVPPSSRSGDSARHIVEEFVRESNLECSAAPSTATANAKGSTTHEFRVEITYEIEIEILWTTLCESVPKEGPRDRGFKRAREELDDVVTSLDPEKLIQTRRSEDGHHELGPLDSKNVAHPPQWRSSDCELRLERVVHAACGDLLQTVDWMCGVLGEFQSLGSGK